MYWNVMKENTFEQMNPNKWDKFSNSYPPGYITIIYSSRVQHNTKKLDLLWLPGENPVKDTDYDVWLWVYFSIYL